MLSTRIQLLFSQYLAGFKRFNLEQVLACYHLPCTLNTPDKIVLLDNKQAITQEFSDIFDQLQQANTQNIVGSKASFTQLSAELVLVCIDWAFIDENKQTFADFSAFYHLIDLDGQLKIINVVSHELENSKALTTAFELPAVIDNNREKQ